MSSYTQQASAAEVDSILGELFTNPACAADPYPTYHRLREVAPVARSQAGHWVLSGYAQVVDVLRSTEVGKDVQSFIRAQGVEDWADHPSYTRVLEHLIWSNPPKHTRQRKLISKGFTAHSIAKLEPKIEQLVDELLTPLAENAGEVDILREFAFPLPASVISEIIGVPREDWPRFQQLFRDVTLAMEPRPSPAQLATADSAAIAIDDYFEELIAKRRKRPEDDLVSTLLAAEDDGEQLSHRELMSLVQFLFGAGFESTTNLIGNGLLALLRNPDQMLALRREPDLAAGAVEELLRYDASVQLSPRTARNDLQLGDVTIPAGESIVALLGAANRDPSRYRDPDRLDVRRTDVKPVSFGGGIHFCLGAALARLEGRFALQGLTRKFSRIELAAEPVWKQSLTLHGLQGLRVHLTPA
ncbi:cytochrome P450 [Streptomyces lomondensis]|uniref:Cytochrome P450 n=1 Tax=Streptomyces lomondensis TaxID=68229 RepID=A0ABQ2X043_9ACTN|nr:cytochrome P450 [Streptomyces lomondensis]MCF0076135.1 cytochrome P450 [Streptomyces lomondensis]GGW88651.1 cytochrome P450 [Streptomyces lomondensis]